MQGSLDTSASRQEDVLKDLRSKEAAYYQLSGSLALLAGTLSISMAAYLWIQSQRGFAITNLQFYLLWLLVAGVSTAIFFIFLRSRFCKAPRFSHRLQVTLVLIAPALLCGTLIPLWLCLSEHRQAYIATHWMIFYGLALLSTAPFAPRSILALGWGFLASGLLAIAVVIFGHDLRVFDTRTAALFMFWTFGLLHLLYGIGVRLSDRKKTESINKED
jgi:hypothetical protein